jgi:phosphate ABC transporter phosphate-binding protein
LLSAVIATSLLLTSSISAQTARSLSQVKRLYVGSLGTGNGSDELRKEVIRYLKKSKEYQLVDTASGADAILEGQGELWVRGYHSLSPRARKNDTYAEPAYSGYLSVRVRGANGEILWSYFADPRRVSIHDLKRDLADEATDRLNLDHNALAASTAPSIPATNETSASLTGGGSTFPLPIYLEWLATFSQQHPAWKFSYQALGSEAGVKALLSGKLDFAGTDIPPASLHDLPSDMTFFPTVGGAVVLIYNLPNFMSDLRLSSDMIAEILSGRIQSWDDPKIAKLNPSAALPSERIRLFTRSDGSGTTFALTDFLSQTNSVWRQTVGAKATVAWSTGKSVSSNDDLAKAVESTQFSLGYVEFIYAFQHHLPFAFVLNRSGRYVRPGLLSIMAAANGAGDHPQDMTVSVVNSGEASAYPISNLTWLAIRGSVPQPKRAAMEEFLKWMLTSGQRQCSALGFAPLPRNLVDQELSAVQRLR